jgi:hypothetical protein
MSQYRTCSVRARSTACGPKVLQATYFRHIRAIKLIAAVYLVAGGMLLFVGTRMALILRGTLARVRDLLGAHGSKAAGVQAGGSNASAPPPFAGLTTRRGLNRRGSHARRGHGRARRCFNPTRERLRAFHHNSSTNAQKPLMR